MTMTELKKFTKHLTAIGCAFIIANERVEVTSGYVDLSSLTTLPEGTTFSNGGYVDLSSLTALKQSYQGKTIRLQHIDGYTMLILSNRSVGEYRLMKCRYFGGGDLDKLRACYVAQSGDYFAHGATPEEAMRDVRFKAMQADFDPDELVAAIKKRGTVERNDFRLLTGACSEGLRRGMADAGLDPDADSLPLTIVMQAAHGSFGAAFKRHFVEVEA